MLNLKGNPRLLGISELQQLPSLRQLHLDEELTVALPAELMKLVQ